MSHSPIRLGVAASKLGRALGDQIAEQLHSFLGSTQVEIVPVEALSERAAGNRPHWPGESLERALLRGEIDLAIQNAKDLSPETAPGLVFAAVTERLTPFDVLIARDETIMDELPEGAAICAHSPLRNAQLLQYRNDFRLTDLPGSLDERIRLLDAERVDGLVVSAAAVEHLGFQDRVTEIFTTEVLVPAAGQGTCVLQAKESAKELIRLAKHLDHPMARSEIEAERAFVREMKADPSMAIGALASTDGSSLRLEGIVVDREGRKHVRGIEEGDMGDEAELGERLARRLVADGARRVLAGAPSEH
ncbi:MAG: hydroxymethylbilane synthase [Candidatus Eiseniibacteriota bacterium]